MAKSVHFHIKIQLHCCLQIAETQTNGPKKIKNQLVAAVKK